MVTRNAQLIVDSFSISIGEHSVGLPRSRSVDTLLTCYLELVAALRTDDRGELRTDDIVVLAAALGVDDAVVGNRLQALSVDA